MQRSIAENELAGGPKTAMRIVFIGAPGAGKGTQSERLVQLLGATHLSTGEMLRDALDRKTKIGLEAQSFLDAGKLAPDSVVVGIIRERLGMPDCARAVIFDGFPRTAEQAQELDALLAERGTPLDMVVELRVADDEVMRRLTGRGRSDDTPRLIAERLQSYWNLTRPLLDYYGRKGILESVDGQGGPDDVFARIEAAIERRKAKGV
jgi:adenylate kinase